FGVEDDAMFCISRGPQKLILKQGVVPLPVVVFPYLHFIQRNGFHGHAKGRVQRLVMDGKRLRRRAVAKHAGRKDIVSRCYPFEGKLSLVIACRHLLRTTDKHRGTLNRRLFLIDNRPGNYVGLLRERASAQEEKKDK